MYHLGMWIAKLDQDGRTLGYKGHEVLLESDKDRSQALEEYGRLERKAGRDQAAHLLEQPGGRGDDQRVVSAAEICDP